MIIKAISQLPYLVTLSFCRGGSFHPPVSEQVPEIKNVHKMSKVICLDAQSIQ